MWDENMSSVATRLLLHGMIQFETEVGFRLKIHEKYPEAPLSPFYVDLRLLRSCPGLIEDVAVLMSGTIQYAAEGIRLICDIPTAATPLAVHISSISGVPMISPRFDVKTHGLKREIDGIWQKGMRVAVIDDLRTTGGSKEEVVELLRRNELEPVSIHVLVDRGADPGAPAAGLPLHAVYQWSELLEFYRADRHISKKLFQKCRLYPEMLDAFVRGQEHQ